MSSESLYTVQFLQGLNTPKYPLLKHKIKWAQRPSLILLIFFDIYRQTTTGIPLIHGTIFYNSIISHVNLKENYETHKSKRLHGGACVCARVYMIHMHAHTFHISISFIAWIIFLDCKIYCKAVHGEWLLNSENTITKKRQ